jgi:hypothetical protein
LIFNFENDLKIFSLYITKGMPPKIKVNFNKQMNVVENLRPKGRPSKISKLIYGEGGHHRTEVNQDPYLMKPKPEYLSKRLKVLLERYTPRTILQKNHALDLGALVEQQYLKQKINPNKPYVIKMYIDGKEQYRIFHEAQAITGSTVSRDFHTNYIVDSAGIFSDRFKKGGKLSIEIQQLDAINPNQSYIQLRNIHFKRTLPKPKINPADFPNCFLDCIQTKIGGLLNQPDISTSYKEKLNSVLNKTTKYKQQYYETGVPLNDIQDIVNNLKIKIKFKGFENQDLLVFTPTGVGKCINVDIMETREAHVELARNYKDAEIKQVSEEEMNELVKSFKENQELVFIKYRKVPTENGDRQIIFANNGYFKYVLMNEDNEIIKEHLNSEKLADFNTTYYKEQYKYYNSGIEVPYARLIKPWNEVYTTDEDGNNKTVFPMSEVFEMDMKKAYTQYKHSPVYCGFPKKINVGYKFANLIPTLEWAKQNHGVFDFTIELNKEKINKMDKEEYEKAENTIEILYRMGLTQKDFDIPQRMRRTNIIMAFLLWTGLFNITIQQGFMSLDSVDFNIPNELIEKKLYSKFVGKMCQKYCLTETFEILKHVGITEQYLSDIATNNKLEGTIQTDGDKTYYVIENNDKKFKSKQHISGHIFDYTLTNVLVELFKFRVEDIVAVKLDSIVLFNKALDNLPTEMIKVIGGSNKTEIDPLGLSEEEINELKIWEEERHLNRKQGSDAEISYEICKLPFKKGLWQSKEAKLISNNTNIPYIGEYILNEPDEINLNLLEFPVSDWDRIKKYKTLLITGQGGSGKTHKYLTNDSFTDLFTTALSWTNVADHSVKYNTWGYSLAIMLGETIDNKEGLGFLGHSKRKHNPSVIFIDEATMIENEDYDKLRKLYPNTLLLVAGDFDLCTGLPYQCYVGNCLMINKNWAVDNLTTDYRAKDCIRLQKLKLALREDPSNGLSVIKDLPRITTEELMTKSLCDPENTNIICGTNKTVELLSEILNWNSGKVIQHSKEDIIQAQLGKGGLLNGMILRDIAGVSPSKVNRQSAFTIHSFQGKTIPTGEKLVFVLDNLFQYQLIYTAISRATSIDQILIYKLP